MLLDRMSGFVGNTPYIRFEEPDRVNSNFLIKLEGYNPSGSVKDRACFHIISSLLDEGILKKGMIILDASSGNFASSVAYFGKIMGFETKLIVSSKITKEKKDFIKFFGGQIHQVGDFTIDGNRYCNKLISSDRNYCFLDQLHNWKNPEAYFKTIGPEILRDVPNIGALVGSIGSGGTMLGAGRFLKSRKADVKVVAVQASVGTRIPGVGSFDDGDYITPFIREGVTKAVFDYMLKVDQSAANRRMLQLRERGIFCGVQTGAVLEAALQIESRGSIDGDIVVISGDAGWKNLDRLVNLV